MSGVRSHWVMGKTWVVAALALAACGCGESVGGRVTGKVIFKGQPVPAGKVYFTPDSSKGNSGPTGFASISNGAYDTSAAGGRGAPSGAVIVRVEGFDPNPPPGADPDITMTMLFSGYETKTELAPSNAVFDIDVPEEAAKGPAQIAAPQTITP